MGHHGCLYHCVTRKALGQPVFPRLAGFSCKLGTRVSDWQSLDHVTAACCKDVWESECMEIAGSAMNRELCLLNRGRGDSSNTKAEQPRRMTHVHILGA